MHDNTNATTTTVTITSKSRTIDFIHSYMCVACTYVQWILLRINQMMCINA